MSCMYVLMSCMCIKSMRLKWGKMMWYADSQSYKGNHT